MKVGSFVQCINDEFNPEQLDKIPNRPILNEYYTIREIIEFNPNHIGIILEEIHNSKIPSKRFGTIEPSFNIERFREIEDMPDIQALLDEIFTEELIET
jgi:hypothetical protein